MGKLNHKSFRITYNTSEKSKVYDNMYRLYVIDKVKKGKDAVLKGKTICIENLKKEVLKW